MALSTLQIDINTLRREVAIRQGWPRTISAWSATHEADFGYISQKALRWFYFPAIGLDIPNFEWSFLYKRGDIKMSSNVYIYDMPDDFSGVVVDESFTWPTLTQQVRPTQIEWHEMWRIRNQEGNAKGWPRYWCIRTKQGTTNTGTTCEIALFPTPSTDTNAVNLHFIYPMVPDALTNTHPYPLGGTAVGDVIIAAHLAAAEEVLDGDPDGPFKKNFISLLTTAARLDVQFKEPTLSEDDA